MASNTEVGDITSYRRAVVDVFVSYHDRIRSVLEGSMVSFTSKAYSAHLISSLNMEFASIFEQFKTDFESCRSISEIQQRYKCFIDILLDIGGPVEDVGKEINKELANLTGGKIQLHLPPTYKYDFDQMRTKLGDLILTVLPLIKSAVTSKLKELKTFLRMSFRELRPQLAIAESFDDVMDIVRERCTIINIACLEAIINHYKIEEAKSHITAYKVEVDQFCEEFKLRVCENNDFMTSPSTLLKCDTIEVTLERMTDEHSFHEIPGVLWKAFRDMAKRVLVKCISDYSDDTVNKDYSDTLKRARKEGHVKVKWTKLSVSGPPGSGKSSFMKLLLNEPPPKCHHSTSVMAVPEIRMITTTPLVVGEATQSLIKVVPNLLKEMLAKTIKKGVKSHSLPTTCSSTVVTVQSDKDDGSDHSSSDEAQDFEQQENETSAEIVSQSQESIPSPVSNATKKILEMLPYVKESTPLLESHWIYAVDSGGQAAFLDIAPAILRYNSVNILTHRLNEKLEDVSNFYFSVEGQKIGNPVERQITNLQLIETSFRSLTSVNPPNLSGIPCSIKEPLSLVLGTFYDKISDSGESLDDKNIKLLSTLKHYENALIVHRVSGNKVIFPVNTIAKDENRQTIAEEICHEICQSYIEAEIPVRWFLFQLHLEEHQTTSNSSIVSKSDCISIGKTNDMDEVDVNAALMYYHDLTIYLYFPEVLPNVVFLNPKPLLDKLSLLISISFADAVDHLKRTLGIRVNRSSHEKLKTQGIFSQDLLTESLLQGFSEDFSPKMFLDLMTYLFILSPLPQSGEYFLPCVLPTTTDLESLRVSYKGNVDPLILTWNEKPLPQGLFPALIVSLLSRKDSPKFDISLSGSDNLQFRNAIWLVCPSFAGAVLLVDGIYWLELFYTGPSNKCYHINEAVKEGIKAVVKKFHYMQSLEDPKERFHCPFCKLPEHFCHLNEDKTKLTCFKNYCSIDKTRQLPWFSPEVKAFFAHKIHEESEDNIQTITTSHTKLDTLNSDAARRALVKCTSTIVESSIDPIVLARKLISEEVISENVYKTVRDKRTGDTSADRLDYILDDLKDHVKQNSSVFMIFLDTLRDDSLNQHDLADKIMLKYKELAT